MMNTAGTICKKKKKLLLGVPEFYFIQPMCQFVVRFV
jgi:hypothetical protein